ncbi:MAG: arylsulfotransferase family protein [Candidatus Promineifilaceae bacterium]|nr:arylsulfotransferase family protein [Candidatus Promineifilaceae bacterium]
MDRQTCQRFFRFFLFLALFFVLGLLISNQKTMGQGISHWRSRYSYLSPLPNAEMVSTETTLALRGKPLEGKKLFDDISLSVNGSRSGGHTGRLVLAEDNETIVFKPDQPFVGDETVRVTLDSGDQTLEYSFTTATMAGRELSLAELFALEDPAKGTENQLQGRTVINSAPYRTAPPNIPQIEAIKGSANTGTGYVFLSPFDFQTFGARVAYLMVLDNSGEPVFYRRFDEEAVMDFKRQPNGQLTYYDRTLDKFFGLNDQYEIVQTYEAGNGYVTNMHDLQVLEDGNFLITIYDLQIIDMSEIVDGGQPDARVVGCIVQELDSQGNVVFEWRSWDHIDLSDTTRDLTFELIDYVHCNSIERDQDGHLLLSSRNLDEISKINRQTGELIWRMGGKKNEFTFVNDDGFSRQHDARRLANGHLTLYDNGVTHNPQRSRGLELSVDEQAKTVTVERAFQEVPDVYARFMGNVQRLPNGNSVLGWGFSSTPVYTEFSKTGAESLQFNMVNGEVSYRAFRYPWEGNPPWPPALIVHANGNVVDLYFSWNGSTSTSAYMLFAKHENDGEWHINNVSKKGFENHYQVTMPKNGLWDFRVVAIDDSFRPTVSSPVHTRLIGGNSFYVPMAAAR